MTDSEQPRQPQYQKVWIACRAKEGCPGNYAEMIHIRTQPTPTGLGQFNASAGGRWVRYRCCTCHGIFTISS